MVALLAVLGAPFFGVKPGFPDDRVLPKSASAHQVGDMLRADFTIDSDSEVPIVIPDSAGLDRAAIDRYAAALSAVSSGTRCPRPVGRSSAAGWPGRPWPPPGRPPARPY